LNNTLLKLKSVSVNVTIETLNNSNQFLLWYQSWYRENCDILLVLASTIHFNSYSLLIVLTVKQYDKFMIA